MYVVVALDKHQQIIVDKLTEKDKTSYNKNMNTNFKGQPKKVVAFDKMSEEQIDNFFAQGGVI